MRKQSVWKTGVLAGCVVGLLGQASPADAQKKPKRAAKASKGKVDSGDLTSPIPDKAIAAAEALGNSKTAGATEALLDALAMGLHPRVASAALDALAKNPKLSSFDVIEWYLHHRSPKVRSSAIKAMGALNDKRAAAHVLAGLRDGHRSVRAAAADLLAGKRSKPAIDALMVLLQKGDDAAAPALASMANPDLARNIAELIGNAPDGLLARCLGAILMRPDFKPEEARVEVVKALGKIPGNDSLEQLTNYVGSIPEKPPRDSRKEAETIIEARLGGM